MCGLSIMQWVFVKAGKAEGRIKSTVSVSDLFFKFQVFLFCKTLLKLPNVKSMAYWSWSQFAPWKEGTRLRKFFDGAHLLVWARFHFLKGELSLTGASVEARPQKQVLRRTFPHLGLRWVLLSGRLMDFSRILKNKCWRYKCSNGMSCFSKLFWFSFRFNKVEFSFYFNSCLLIIVATA